jgi:CRISPR-associated endonuclease Cas2
MSDVTCCVTECSPGKIKGPSPAEDRYYVLVLFDISDQKKYRLLLKILKRYGARIQRSVFEAQLKSQQIRDLSVAIEKLMAAERYANPDDNVRIYKIASNCSVTVFGKYESNLPESDIFI